MRTAVYAGSFDPPTYGHLWMIERGLALFDRLIVAIGSNPSKTYSFSVAQRKELLRACAPSSDRLLIAQFDNRYLVDFAGEMNADYILRGIRSPHDYEYERVMRHINADMAPHVQTVFLMPPRDIAELSSSMVKSLIGPEGWQDIVSRYVPPAVFAALDESVGDER
jgi:pantetheine-phosphate adenylyltransferase